MDKTVLVIETDMMLKRDTLNKLREQFVEQVKEGVVIIPAYFHCRLIQVPENVEIEIQARDIPHEFLRKDLNVPMKGK